MSESKVILYKCYEGDSNKNSKWCKLVEEGNKLIMGIDEAGHKLN